LADDIVANCLAVHNENLLIGSNRGIIVYNLISNSYHLKNNGFHTSKYFFTNDAQGNIFTSPDLSGTLYRYRSNQQNWTQESVVPGDIVQIDGFENSHVLVVHLEQSSNSALFLKKENSPTWEQIYEGSINKVKMAGKNEIFITNDEEGVLRQNKDNSWTAINSGLPKKDGDYNTEDILISPEGTVIVECGESLYILQNNHWSLTLDSGVASISSHKNGQIWAGAMGIFVSNDLGKTWKNQGLHNYVCFRIVHFHHHTIVHAIDLVNSTSNIYHFMPSNGWTLLDSKEAKRYLRIAVDNKGYLWSISFSGKIAKSTATIMELIQ
jgi:hypothetical protein